MAEYGQTVTANEAERHRRIKCGDGGRRGEEEKDSTCVCVVGEEE